ncbi:hypothetical protein CB0940_04552 [Cercospora beticola]|uniref:Uncharacterized protein n=1 Tax=Cercospora beticola TaxID=122368 RepID=A0A2G5HL71_CERBT|nr:hypothetical protein CB0940_04552 [Cercospora beticola]PIA93316.1 hypothetical protein CB0940_04552 [Cercospora beticola]WPB01801.1 hypothetical protein RHO25_006433 [Cercospora beticola]CAK1363366.1 unnamed protein product [Cercospora beticola]
MSEPQEFPVPGRLLPVCCATVVTPEIIDNLITISETDSMESFFVIMDKITGIYNDQTKVGDWTQPTSEDSPFIDKSPMACYLLLRQLISDTDSDINHEHFAIFDERTLRDGSIVLVDGPWGKGEDEGVARTVRVAPEIAQERLLLYNIGEPEIDEDQAIAQEAVDGVLRVEALMNRPPT